jgi:hypothetical protein
VSRKPLDEFEVLSDAGWLFDDFVNAEMRKVLVSQPEDPDQREPDRDLRSGFGACRQAPGAVEGAARATPAHLRRMPAADSRRCAFSCSVQ